MPESLAFVQSTSDIEIKLMLLGCARMLNGVHKHMSRRAYYWLKTKECFVKWSVEAFRVRVAAMTVIASVGADIYRNNKSSRDLQSTHIFFVFKVYIEFIKTEKISAKTKFHIFQFCSFNYLETVNCYQFRDRFLFQ